MKYLEAVFPFRLYLTILQLEGYSLFRFYRWFIKNLFVRRVPQKKGLVVTGKVKIIIFLSLVWFFLISLLFTRIFQDLIWTFLFLLALLMQPHFLYLLAVASLKPYEIWNKKRVVRNIRMRIDSFRELKVIGITGSYGKTSVKEILYQLLKPYRKVLRTPESYNTVFGISKVVDLELDDKYEFFVCEMGAYRRGEIRELCRMVNPRLGIITGIAEQHLERFGNIDNIKKAKFELSEHVGDNSKMTYNTEDENVSDELKTREIKYSDRVKTKNVSFSKEGSVFELVIGKRRHKVESKLFGFQNVENIRLAAEASLMIGLSAREIIQAVRDLEPFSNRFVLKQTRNTTVVDNTYNSNCKSFLETIRTAKAVKGKKALVTPGLVELGESEEKIHRRIGRASDDVFDRIIFVGKNRRGKAFSEALKGRGDFKFIDDTREEYNKAVLALVEESFDWVFLENDVTENY